MGSNIKKGKLIPTAWSVIGVLKMAQVYKCSSFLLFKAMVLNVCHMALQRATPSI